MVQEVAARAEVIKVKRLIAGDPKLCGHAVAAQQLSEEGFARPSKLEVRERAGPIIRRIQAELLKAAPVVGSVAPVVVASTNTELFLNVVTASGVSVPATVAV